MNKELTLIRPDSKAKVYCQGGKTIVEYYAPRARRANKTISLLIDTCVVINRLLELGYEFERKQKLYPAVKEIQNLLWKNDDIIDQESLFKVQDKIAKLALKIANEQGKSEQIAKDFPFLYKKG